MKNNVKARIASTLGVTVFVAIIGFSMSVLSLTGCESPTGGGNGNSSSSSGGTDNGGNGGNGGGGNPTIINIAAIQGVTVPIAGGTPVTAITDTVQYSGTIAWAPAVSGTFAAKTAYTATITLTPKTGFTLKGVTANFFTVEGSTSATNTADSGVITAVFPKLPGTAEDPAEIDIKVIGGVTAPVFGVTPVTTITETEQYTGTVVWDPAVSDTFAAEIIYTANITLTAKTGFTLQGVTANFFTVAGATTVTVDTESGVITAVFPKTGEAPVYAVSLSPASYTFTSVVAGYNEQSPLTVTVTNTGNQATGALTAALSGTNADSFTLSTSSINSIAVGETAAFTVRPNTDLSAGTYTATVTVTGGNSISAGFNGSFTVDAVPSYGITISQTENYSFTPDTFGYGAQNPLTIEIRNTGSQATGNLTAALGGTNSGNFTLSKTSITSIAVSDKDTFTVAPVNNLSAGTYTATVTVSGSNVSSKAFNVSFTVKPKVITFTIDPISAQTYTGNAITPAVTVKDGSTTLALTTHYTVSYSNNTAAGTATVTVTGAGNYAGSTGSTTFTIAAATAQIYSISLSPTGTYTFDSLDSGYSTAPTALTVTVTNTGNQATGALTVGLSSTTNFTLSTTSISNIANNGTATFTVQPKTGLAVNTYNATVTVSGGNSISASFNVSFAVTNASAPYIINGSNTSFTATKSGATIGTASQPIQNVINAIRTHATGKDPTIQFGNGTAVLNIDTASASFNNTGGTWGAITLTGKVTSTNANWPGGTIFIDGSVSVTSSADIANTADDSDGNAIFNNSTGTLTITGGTVSAKMGSAVFNESEGEVNISGGAFSVTGGVAIYNESPYGDVYISGGTVSATTGLAVWNVSTGKITVSGATTKISSACTDSGYGTIYLESNGFATAERLEISGGTVENTAAGANAIAVYNNSNGAVTISGGTIKTAGTYAVYITKPNSMLTLDGNPSPTITGRIRPSAAGKLTAANGFTPGSKTYTLEYLSYAAGNIAVARGANYLSNFTVPGQALVVNGVNLVIADPNAPYIITLNGTDYTATKNGVTIATEFFYPNGIHKIIDFIQTDATGRNPTIQFGDLTNVLEVISLGGALSFNNTNGTWGTITLTGKITAGDDNTIVIADNVSVITTADIANTKTKTAVYHNSTGTLSISGGTVSAKTGYAVNSSNTGKITISGATTKVTSDNSTIALNSSKLEIQGGTVSATNGTAVSGNATISGGTVSATTGTAVSGTVTISGGTVSATTGTAVSGNATISGGTVSVTTGTAVNGTNNTTINISGNANISATQGGTAVKTTPSAYGSSTVNITGGTISTTGVNDGAYGTAVYTDATSTSGNTGTIKISGGTISTENGTAVYIGRSGEATISGGTVKATYGKAVNIGYSGKLTVSGTANITSTNWDNSTGGTITASGPYANITIQGGTVENTYTNGNAIFISSGNNQPLNISSGTVKATSGKAIYNNGNEAVINITGGTVLATTGIAIFNGSLGGKITISGATTKVTSANVSTSSAGRGTIYLESTSTTGNNYWLQIDSGTVENTGTNGYAIYNNSGVASRVLIKSAAVITGQKYGA